MDDMPPSVSEPPAVDWSLLPLDVLSLIFHRIGAVDVLMGAGLACRSWLEAAKLPELWRAVDMDKHDVVFRNDDDVLCAMAKAVVDRSDGQLRSFAGKLFVNDELMEYIAERSPLLTSLRLVSCRDLVLGSVMHESSLLELRSLELYDINLTGSPSKT
ncbi:hypothetical protein ZWY2020_018633 [Hordeum vulgare]|nr:hypothetical protein ZWY2020_018633 [Hordeum vulgare]